MDWNTVLLSHDERTFQRDFWVGAVVLFAAGFAANIVPLVGTLASIALLYPWTRLLGKRLHDLDTSGWLVLLPAVPAALASVIAPIAGLAMGNAVTLGTGVGAAGLALFVSSLAMLIGLGFLLWVGLSDGDPSPNRCGAPTELARLV